MHIPTDTYYTPAEILEKLGYNPESRMILYRMMKKGKLTPFYIGNLLRFRESQNKWVFEN
jgi:hypothetical protein